LAPLSKDIIPIASMSGAFDLFGREHKAVFGASYIRSNLKVDEWWGYDGFPVDIFDPDPDLPIPDQVDDGIAQDRDYLQYGVYGQVNYKLADKLTALVGGRVNWADLQSDVTAIADPDYRENAFFTPLLGVVYDITPAVSLYASYVDIYEAQFQRDLERQPLPPLTGTQYEVGIKTELFDGRVAASAAVFDITRKNQAYLVGAWRDQIYIADGTIKSRA